MQALAQPSQGSPADGWPVELHAPLRQFVFETSAWCRPRALAAALGLPASAVDAVRAPEAAWRQAIARFVPPGRLDASLLCRDLRGRLALLPREDWMRLGLCLCVLPACGQIQRSVDGHFRRAVQQLLDEEAIQGLDGMGDGLPAMRPVLLAGPGAWRAPERLATGAVRAAMDQACLWTEPVRQRVGLRFEPEELQGPHSVRGIDMTWLEIACKALWPQHPWLWS